MTGFFLIKKMLDPFLNEIFKHVDWTEELPVEYPSIHQSFFKGEYQRKRSTL